MLNTRLIYPNDIIRFPGKVLQIASSGTELVILANLHDFDYDTLQVSETKESSQFQHGRVFVMADVIKNGSAEPNFMKLSINEV